MIALVPLFFLVVALASVPLAWIIRDTARKRGKWGINVENVVHGGGRCPRCDTPLPRIRRPTSLRQVLWGGWTCSGCGIELDKWGRAIGASAPKLDDVVPVSRRAPPK